MSLDNQCVCSMLNIYVCLVGDIAFACLCVVCVFNGVCVYVFVERGPRPGPGSLDTPEAISIQAAPRAWWL